ncbi:MAG: YeeE/YedE thiosulfate transporter family protein [Victivallaceae bacterium]|nr:YeeE/YedE thiosulfate transporter family protein [Victivallaceae bacterium]
MKNNSSSQTGKNPAPLMNPYLAGVFLGLTLLASYLILGVGLGASGGLARLGAFLEGLTAPAHTANSAYFGKWGANPLYYYLVFMLGGVLLGGLFSALAGGRVKFRLIKGQKAAKSRRVILTVAGGIFSGFAARLASGCTSGQALSGGAMLLSGSLVFMLCLFIGGYAAAWFVRRQWDD